MSDKCLRYEQSIDDITNALEELPVHRKELDALGRKKATKDELFIFQDQVSAKYLTNQHFAEFRTSYVSEKAE